MFDRFTLRARKVMGLGRQEALSLNHDYFGTEHLLLGLVQEGSGAGSVLGIPLPKVRHVVETLAPAGTTGVTTDLIPFTPRAKKALELSLEEARALGHTYIGTKHLFLGLLGVDDGNGALALTRLGVRAQDVRASVLAIPDGEDKRPLDD